MSQEYRKREIRYPDNDTSENLRKYYDAVDRDEKILPNILIMY